MGQDWEIAFHQEDSFIVGYGGSRFDTTIPQKTDHRAAGNRVKRNLRARLIYPISEGPSVAHLSNLFSKAFRDKMPVIYPSGTFKRDNPQDVETATCSSFQQAAPAVLPQAGKQCWEHGKAGCCFSQNSTGGESPSRANPPALTSPPKTFSGSQETRCWAGSTLHPVAGLHPFLSFLVISVSIWIP